MNYLLITSTAIESNTRRERLSNFSLGRAYGNQTSSPPFFNPHTETRYESSNWRKKVNVREGKSITFILCSNLLIEKISYNLHFHLNENKLKYSSWHLQFFFLLLRSHCQKVVNFFSFLLSLSQTKQQQHVKVIFFHIKL